MNENKPLDVAGGLEIYPEDTPETLEANRLNTITEFIKDSNLFDTRISRALEKHGKYDPYIYAELCKIAEDFTDRWANIMGGMVATQIRDAVKHENIAEYKGPKL